MATGGWLGGGPNGPSMSTTSRYEIWRVRGSVSQGAEIWKGCYAVWYAMLRYVVCYAPTLHAVLFCTALRATLSCYGAWGAERRFWGGVQERLEM
eukprot:693051-Rhodomonas_salina.1